VPNDDGNGSFRGGFALTQPEVRVGNTTEVQSVDQDALRAARYLAKPVGGVDLPKLTTRVLLSARQVPSSLSNANNTGPSE
jgi:hypothetical protein